MATEPVLPTAVATGQSGALANWDTANLFHNNWIHSSGQRTFLPTDFLLHNAGPGLDTATTKLSIADTSTMSSDAETRVTNILDQRTVSANQSGGLSGLRIDANPQFTGPTRNIFAYDALSIYAVPGNGFAGLTISNYSAIGLHFDGVVGGVTMPLMCGLSAHMGMIASLAAEMRTVHAHYHLLFGGGITKATGFYLDDSDAQRTWGFHIGGRAADSTDAYPSYHMGPIALGGVPTAGGIGGEFSPSYMLDLRERRKMVRSVSIVTHSNNLIEPAVGSQGTIYPTNIFDFPFEGGATVAASGIPGGTTLSFLFSPISAQLSANATASATVTATITKPLTDQSASAMKMSPQYDGAVTIVRHNYLWVDTPILVNGAAVNDACVFRYDAAIGTHKALDNGTTKTSPGTVSGWVKHNVAGTIMYSPLYTSKTS